MISLTTFSHESLQFRPRGEAQDAIRAACREHNDVASVEVIGESEGGRPILGVVLGTGSVRASLIAGNHADEPVGPQTLRSFIVSALDRREKMEPWLRRYQFVIVPHTNPDGEAANRAWIDAWPDVEAYLRHVVREEPGRDLEFGFPEMRPENAAVSAFLGERGPYDLHASLHGMASGEGAALLINRPWTFRTQSLRDRFVEAARSDGLAMHDHNRKGEKGFFWIEPGFQTTPRGDAMRTYFQAKGDEQMAARFHQSSMEYIMSLGGDPLCLVTELPLFLIEGAPEPAETPAGAHVPARYLALKERLPAIRKQVADGRPVESILDDFDLSPVPLDVAVRLQLRAVELGLQAVS
jgi:hypothetical protein